jgi:CHAD domain-containing protein
MNVDQVVALLSELLARIETERRAAVRRSRESVHDLRVSLKRLRAFSRLTERLNPDFDAGREYAPFRRLFKAAAGLRDLHILQDASLEGLRRHGSGLSAWINELKIRESVHRLAFEKAASRRGACPVRRFSARVEKAWTILPVGSLSLRAEEALYLGIRRLCRRGIPAASEQAALHLIRIESKEIRYMIEIIDAALGRPEGRALLSNRLKDVHQALGRWHDATIVGAAFTAFNEAGQSGVPAPIRTAFAQDLEYTAAHSLAEFGVAWDLLFPPALGPD